MGIIINKNTLSMTIVPIKHGRIPQMWTDGEYGVGSYNRMLICT